MAFALSTSWNAFRQLDGERLLFEIKELGFDRVELSFNLTPALLGDIQKSLKKTGMRVISCHNFCPIPDGLEPQKALPDCYSLASTDEAERRTALKFTKRSIDTAASLSAQAVVLHCGRVEITDRTRDLIALFNAGQKDSKEFGAIKDAAIKERSEAVTPFFDNALESLEELERHAAAKGISLGVETRFYYPEIPSPEETATILTKFAGSSIFYWHDTGHAQVMENLGFFRHKDCLEIGKHRLLGVHLHDVTGCKDHRAPGQGELDFTLLKPYLNNETLKVIEAHHPELSQDIVKGKEFLERIFHEIS